MKNLILISVIMPGVTMISSRELSIFPGTFAQKYFEDDCHILRGEFLAKIKSYRETEEH